MRKVMLIIALMLGLLLPSVVTAETQRLYEESLDSVHAQGLTVYLDFNIFLPSELLSVGGLLDSQIVGDGNSGNVLLNSVSLSGDAQQNLSALVNLNAANSVIPFGINITVINGDNNGTVNQSNYSLGFLNSSLYMIGGGGI